MVIMRQIDAKQEKYIDHSPCQNSPCQKLHPYFTNLQTYPFLLFFFSCKICEKLYRNRKSCFGSQEIPLTLMQCSDVK